MPPAPALPPDAIERQPDAPLDPIGVLRDRIRTLNTDPSVQRSLITDINALEYQDSYRMHIPDLVARLRNRREILVGASQDLLNKLFGMDKADHTTNTTANTNESTAATLAASSELRMLYDRASEHEVRNEKDMARQLFHQLIDLDAAPNQLWKAIGQGRLNFLDGDYNGARRIFEQIVTQAPSFWLGWYNRGRTRAMQNDYEGAISDCTETLRLEASYAPAYVTRGFARKAMSDDDGALSDYNEAIQLNPNLALAYNNRGLARAEQGDHDAAISDYNEAIRLAPKLALAYNNRGLARYHKSDHEGALSDYNQAIRLDAKLALAYSNRGIIFEGRQQHQAAASDYQRALELSSMNDPNYLNIYVLKREYIKKYLG
jgi:tetratricopeptide (TPR) repeat protein